MHKRAESKSVIKTLMALCVRMGSTWKQQLWSVVSWDFPHNLVQNLHSCIKNFRSHISSYCSKWLWYGLRANMVGLTELYRE